MSDTPYLVVGAALLPVFSAITSFVHEWGHAVVVRKLTTDVRIRVGHRPFVHVPAWLMRLIGLDGVTGDVGLSLGAPGRCSHSGLPKTVTYEQLFRLLRAGYRATFLMLLVAGVPGLFVGNFVLDAVGAGSAVWNFALYMWVLFLCTALISTVVNAVYRRPPLDGRPSTDAWRIRQLKRMRKDSKASQGSTAGTATGMSENHETELRERAARARTTVTADREVLP